MFCNDCNSCSNYSKDSYKIIPEFKQSSYNCFGVGELFKVNNYVFKVVFNEWDECNHCDNDWSTYFDCSYTACHNKNFILYDTLDSDSEED